MSIELVMLSNHLILCCFLLLLPSIFPSIRVFPNDSLFTLGGQSIGASASASSVCPWTKPDWLVWSPAVQGTLRSLLQHHNSKASILRRSAFFMVQLSNLYITTGKTIALTIQTFVGKMLSLLFNPVCLCHKGWTWFSPKFFANPLCTTDRITIYTKWDTWKVKKEH